MGGRVGRSTGLVEVEGFNLRPMREKLRQFGGQEWRKEPPTIYRVPHWIRKGHEDAYEPRIVSIGPYHYNNPRLEVMEQHKWRYLHDFLYGNDIRLEDCIKEMKVLEEKARSSYAETVCLVKDVKTSEEQARSTETTLLTKSESDAFVEMLVLDGCFLIEFFLKFKDRRLFKDPMYIAKWVMPSVLHDMILLENQLPFFILQQLFDLIQNPNSSLMELADNCFINRFKLNGETRPREVFHLLHLFHLKHQPNEIEHTKKKPSSFYSQLLPAPNPPQPRLDITIPCAARLNEAGIKFKKGGEKDNFLEVKFIEGVLILPPLAVEDDTECRFRNLIAFEQCCPRLVTFFTTYAVFMDDIINTSDDVQILEEKGIIVNLLGSEQKVAELFNNICLYVVIDVDSSYLREIFKEVSIYGANDWNKCRAKLMHDYFNNPWSVFSLVGATLLLILTLLQAVFSGIPVFQHSPSPPTPPP
ncbi:UPF0481 protein At3g47200-like [Tasmannia lanceolata]|uniref:UPF0481 protein At3g47200-like n=1 Tax=Tasmannia lanceolata TaxID=3420 RepID=UPI00406338A4